LVGGGFMEESYVHFIFEQGHKNLEGKKTNLKKEFEHRRR